jgi:predicted flavoprotein YhiN
VQRDFAKYTNKQLKNALDDLLPKSMIPVLIRLSEIEPEKPVNQVNKEERKRFCRLLQSLSLTVTGTLGMGIAIVNIRRYRLQRSKPCHHGVTPEQRAVLGRRSAGY